MLQIRSIRSIRSSAKKPSKSEVFEKLYRGWSERMDYAGTDNSFRLRSHSLTSLTSLTKPPLETTRGGDGEKRGFAPFAHALKMIIATGEPAAHRGNFE
jgi:hypothetical protein